MPNPKDIVLQNIRNAATERTRNQGISQGIKTPQKPVLRNTTAEHARTPQWMKDITDGKTYMDNGDGTVSTMKSVTYEADGKTYLAPSIRLIDGKPKALTMKEAVELARKNHDAIPFDSQKEADEFDKKFHEQEYQRLGVGPSPSNTWPTGKK